MLEKVLHWMLQVLGAYLGWEKVSILQVNRGGYIHTTILHNFLFPYSTSTIGRYFVQQSPSYHT
jgi:hypothetical protein